MVTMTIRRSAIMDITEHHRSALSRVLRRYLALARMRLAPERGSYQNEAPGQFNVTCCVSSFLFSTHMLIEMVQRVGADNEFASSQVV